MRDLGASLETPTTRHTRCLPHPDRSLGFENHEKAPICLAANNRARTFFHVLLESMGDVLAKAIP